MNPRKDSGWPVAFQLPTKLQNGWCTSPEVNTLAENSRAIDVIHYDGSNHVDCYACAIFDKASDQLHRKIDQLLAQNLSWTWLSESRLLSPEQSNPHFSRRLTLLSDSSSNLLLEDFEFRDEDGYGLFVALFGCRDEFLLTDSAQLNEELERFCSGRSTALDIAVIRPSDDALDYIFFRGDSGGIADALLEAEIGPEGSVKFVQRPYRRLRTASLENLFLGSVERTT
jgi:hypothetical protein